MIPTTLERHLHPGITAKAAPVASICDAARRASEDASRWPQHPNARRLADNAGHQINFMVGKF
jgi:hypothetical protein